MQTFKRSLTPLDWPRFQFYASRMKHLLTYSCKLSLSTFRAIDNSLDLGHSHRPLLPNLRELTYGGFTIGDSLHDTCMFLSPHLSKLSLSITPYIIGLKTFLSAVESRCPSLSNLRIEVGGHFAESVSEEGARAVSNFICGLSGLQEVFSDFRLNHKALILLASLPNLWKFHGFLPTGPALRVSQADFPLLPFPALRYLYARVTSIVDAEEFFQLISSSSGIESLSIDVSTIPPSHELYMFLTTVPQSSFRDTLTHHCLLYAH